MVFNKNSERFLNFIKETSTNYINNLLRKNFYYKEIKKNILKFKFWLLTIEELLNLIQPYIRITSLYLSYFFSYYDSCRDLVSIPKDLKKCTFYREESMEIIHYFREKYQNNDFGLQNGVKLMENYLSTFGLKIQNTTEGLYVQVSFI